MNYLYLFLGVSIGLVVMVYTAPIVKIFGHMDWAEQRFGPGGTYTAWKLMGVGLIVAGMIAFRMF